MEDRVANSVGVYIEMLYDVNIKLIKLCGMDALNVRAKDEILILDIIQDIFRLFPCTYDKKKQNYVLDTRGGLLEFKDAFYFIESDFLEILKSHYEFLSSVMIIRNKCTHRMHEVKIVEKEDGTRIYFNFVIEVKDKSIRVCADDFIKFVCSLNETYGKIQGVIFKFAEENDKSHYEYYDKITRFNLCQFSKIYQDSNLRLIGKIMHPF